MVLQRTGQVSRAGPARGRREHKPVSHPALGAAADLLNLQRAIGNRAVSQLVGSRVDRLVDGFYGDGTKVPKSRITLTPAFKAKHVADDAMKARQVTGARIDSGKPPAMVQGQLGNTVAREEDWITAIDNSTAVIPDQDAWSGGMAIKITGWDAKRTAPNERKIALTALADAARTVGGYMAKQGGKVEIDHVAGQQS